MNIKQVWRKGFFQNTYFMSVIPYCYHKQRGCLSGFIFAYPVRTFHLQTCWNVAFMSTLLGKNCIFHNIDEMLCIHSPILGGDGGHALYLQADLTAGHSERCDTFESPPLCRRSFKIQSLEVWGIQHSLSVPPLLSHWTLWERCGGMWPHIKGHTGKITSCFETKLLTLKIECSAVTVKEYCTCTLLRYCSMNRNKL